MQQCHTRCSPPARRDVSITRRLEQKASRVMRKKKATLAKRVPVSPTSETKPAVASVLAEPSPNCQPASEEAIRLCAYRKWETAGKPVGNSVNFWLEAERELAQAK